MRQKNCGLLAKVTLLSKKNLLANFAFEGFNNKFWCKYPHSFSAKKFRYEITFFYTDDEKSCVFASEQRVKKELEIELFKSTSRNKMLFIFYFFK